MTKTIGLCLVLVVFILNGCATLNPSATSYLPDTFTTENIMKAHEGMNADEVLKMFGNPKNVSQAVCGGENSWNCTTWEYGKFPYDRASFTFNSSNSKTPILNNFSIERKGSSLPATFSTENTLKIKQGMSSKKILEIFGYPVSVKQSVCGGATANLWICTTWDYGEFPYARASFTFSGEHNSLMLNNFSIDKD